MLLTMSWSLENVKEVRVGQLKNVKEAPGTADLIFALGENNLCLTETQDPSRTIDVWSGKKHSKEPKFATKEINNSSSNSANDHVQPAETEITRQEVDKRFPTTRFH